MIGVFEFQENTKIYTENMDISLITNEIKDSRDRYEYVFSHGKRHILQSSKQLGKYDVIQGALSCCNLSHSSTRISENMKRMGKRYKEGATCPYRPKPDRAVPLLEEEYAGVLPARGGGSSIGGKKERVRSSKEKGQSLLRICPGKEGF